MAKVKISEYSATPSSNTDIDNIDINENCSPSGINNAIRALMSHLKNWQGGTSGDTLPVASGGTGSANTTTARSNLGAAASGANSDITSITGLTTPLSVAQGGTGSSTAANARTALGLGSIATQASNSVSITGGSISGITDLAVADGGTGLSTLTANNVIIGNGTSAVTFVAPSTAGNVLTSNGTTWTSAAAFVSGMIMLWSGSSATIPTGWLLCNGANGTPDLRNRFVVGATSTYAVGATGGSADAIVVSHTHTATVTDTGHVHGVASDNNNNNGGSSRQRGGDNSQQGTFNSSSATTGITVSNSTTGISGTNANLPPYYALCYIMKS